MKMFFIQWWIQDFPRVGDNPIFWQISEALHEIFDFRLYREWAMEYPHYLNISTSKVIGYVNAEFHHMQPSSDSFIP